MPPAQKSRPLPIDAPQRRRLPPLLRRAWYGLNQEFRRRVAHLRITPDQFTVLRILLESDTRGITQRELTEAMSSDPNTVASLLERMEKAGLLRRKPHEKDRRAYRITVRQEGTQRYHQARAIAVKLQTEVLSALPAPKREEFLKHLAHVAEAISALPDRLDEISLSASLSRREAGSTAARRTHRNRAQPDRELTAGPRPAGSTDTLRAAPAQNRSG